MARMIVLCMKIDFKILQLVSGENETLNPEALVQNVNEGMKGKKSQWGKSAEEEAGCITYS
jgi:hypothetical protein